MYPQQSVTYHHAVGVVASGTSPAGEGEGVSGVSPWVPTKPFVALLGFLCIVGFAAWLTLGRAVAGSYYDAWWRAVPRSSPTPVRRYGRCSAAASLLSLRTDLLPIPIPSE
jgi:hypothetical protein